MARPQYVPTDTLDRFDRADFDARTERDLWGLSFNHQSEQDIQSLKLPDLPMPAPLPVVVSPQPQIHPLQTSEQMQNMWQSGNGGAPDATRMQPPQDTQSSEDGPIPPSAAPASASAGGAPPPAGAPSPSSTPAAMPTGAGGDLRTVARSAAAQVGVRPDIYERLIEEEGGFAPGAVSSAGARGPAQLMPATARELGVDPNDPNANIVGGARYLAQMLKKYGGDYQKALAAYNWGPGNVDSGQPIPGETSAYVQRVLTPKPTQSSIPGPDQSPNGTPITAPAQPQGQALPDKPSTNIGRPTQFAEGLSYGEAIAACGLAGVAWFIAKSGRTPKTVAEVKQAAEVSKTWDAGAGMHGIEATASLLRDTYGIAAHVENGVDFNKVRTDVLNGNPVLFDTNAGSAGHYYAVLGARQRPDGQWEYNLDTSATDLKASKGKQWYTENEIEGLGFGRPFKAIYSDNPQTPAPSVVAGPSPIAAGASPPPAAAPVASAGQPDPPQTALAEGSTMYRQPLGQPAPVPMPGNVDDQATGANRTYSPPPDSVPDRGWIDRAVQQPDDRLPGYQRGDVTDAEGLDRTTDDLYPVPGPAGPMPGYRDQGSGVMYRQPLGVPTAGPDASTGTPSPGTAEPIRNPDGSVTTERSITVTDPRLNGGAPTNIPTVWGGTIVSDDEAIDNASRSGMPWPSYPSIKLAVQAARQRTDDLGAGRTASVGGATVPWSTVDPTAPNLSPDVVNATTDVNRSLIDNLVTPPTSYRQPLGPTAGPDTFPTDASGSGVGASGSGPETPPYPASQAIPDEDPTAIPRPAYVPPAEPLVEAPPQVSRFDPLAGNAAPAQPSELPTSAAPTVKPPLPLYDMAGNLTGYVQDQAQSAAQGITSAVEQAAPVASAAFNAARLPNPIQGIPAVSSGAREMIDSSRDQITRWQELNDKAMAARLQGGPPLTPDEEAEYADLNTAVAAGTLAGPAEGHFTAPDASAVAPITERIGNAVQDIRGRLAAGSERAAAAEAQRAASGTVGQPAYGAFGFAPNDPAAEAVGRPRFVPPEVRESLGIPREIPDDPRFAQAVESVGGQITDRGVELHVTRAQGESAAGGVATRGGVFVEPVPEGGRSSYATSADNPNAVGGTQVLPATRTLYRKPMVLDDAPGDMRGFNRAAEQLGILNAAGQPAVAADVDAWVRAARRYPEGSPQRAQMLKDGVQMFGGDPSVIDDLLAIRGVDANESAWAIKENIVAANARKAGYDGVFTLQEQTANWNAINQHSLVVEAEQKLKALGSELSDAKMEYERLGGDSSHQAGAPGTKEAGQRYVDAMNAYNEASTAYEKAQYQAEKLLSSPKITEIFDVQQGRNPTPGAPNPRIEAAKRAYDNAINALKQADAAHKRAYGQPNASQTGASLAYAKENANQTWRAYDKLTRAEPEYTGPPGYSLHPDLVRPTADAGEMAAGSSLGVVPVPMRSHTDVLASVNRAAVNTIGRGAMAGVYGTAAGLTNQAMNPDDPNAFVKGALPAAALSAFGPQAARAALRAAGKVAPEAEGALASLGAAPGGGHPQATVQAAQQIAQNPQSPLVARRLATGIQRAARQGIPPALPSQAPGFPAPPPRAPATFNDAVQAWRYSMGLFGSISTGLLQTIGGAAEVALGAPTEIIRQAILRGHPEHLPLIIGEALKSVPSGARSFGETAAGKVPPTIMAGTDYRPPLSDKLSGPARAAALAVETPGRVATQAPDAFWYEIYYRTGLAQAAAEEAQKTAGRMNPAASWQAQQQLIANPTPEMIDRAHAFAQNSTYKGELGTVAKAIGTIFRGPENPTSGLGRAWKEVGSYIMPVYHTIARIHEGSLEYAPGIGLLPLNRLGLAARGRSTDTKIAQQIVGLGLTAGILGYASQGGIRGPGPSDPDKLKEMIDQGYTPNTTNIGGIWVRNSDLGKAGPLINMVGAYNDAVTYGNGKDQFDAQRWDQKTKALVDGFARSLSDYPAAQAFSTILKARTDPVGALTELGAGAASQFVPSAYRTYAGAVDTNARTTNRGPDVPPEQRFAETFEQRSGVGRQSLPVAQNRLGEDQPNVRQGWNVFLPRVGQDRPNTVEQTFLNNGVDLGPPPPTVSYTPKGGRNKGVETAPVPLTPAEQRKWNTYRGEAVKDDMVRTTQSAFWQRAGREDKQDELKAILAAANKAASERVIDDMGKDYDRRLEEGITKERTQRGLAPAGR